MRNICLLLILIAQAGPAFSATNSVEPEDSSKDLFFILRGLQEPVGMSMGRPKVSKAKIMQMPDVDVRSKNLPTEDHRSRAKSTDDESSDLAAQKNEKPAVTSIKFKKTRISGMAKLPSIQFDNFEPTVELREEMPSLDFTAKSLKDGGF